MVHFGCVVCGRSESESFKLGIPIDALLFFFFFQEIWKSGRAGWQSGADVRSPSDNIGSWFAPRSTNTAPTTGFFTHFSLTQVKFFF